MSGPRYLRNPLSQMLLSAVCTVGVLGALEVGMRWTGLPDPGLYTGDPAWLWWLRPDLDREWRDPESGRGFRVTTNALGLRGPPPPTEAHWMLAMGCSTTFGWGVEELEAWPARLSALRGEAVVNGGMPGWSTAQAVRGMEDWLKMVEDHPPARVILAFGVRDAQLAARPDSANRPAHPLQQSRWALLLGSLRPRRLELSPSVDGVPRVAPDELGRNLRWLVDQWQAVGAATTVFLFPQPGEGLPPESVAAARDAVGPSWLDAPQLPDSAFFSDDPIHLTPAGHLQLAEWLNKRL